MQIIIKPMGTIMKVMALWDPQIVIIPVIISVFMDA